VIIFYTVFFHNESQQKLSQILDRVADHFRLWAHTFSGKVV